MQARRGVVALNSEPDATVAATRRLQPLDIRSAAANSMQWHADVGGVDAWSVSIKFLRLTTRESDSNMTATTVSYFKKHKIKTDYGCTPLAFRSFSHITRVMSYVV